MRAPETFHDLVHAGTRMDAGSASFCLPQNRRFWSCRDPGESMIPE